MGYLATLANFYKDLCKRAASNEKPETVLTRDNISESFLSFIDQYDDGNKERESFRKLYEEERKKNADLEWNEFIYTRALFVKEKRDIGTEYLRLKEESEGYLSLLQEKKDSYEKQLKAMGSTKSIQKEKIKYYKVPIEKRLKKAKKQITTEKLVSEAIKYCIEPYYTGLFNEGFVLDILSVQDIDTDKRDLVCFEELSPIELRKMVQLRETNEEAYLDAFGNMISSLHIIEKIIEIAKKNYYLYNREKILHTAFALFSAKNYESFVYLIVPQIEGLFQVYLRLLGDNSICDGFQKIAKKIKETEDFLEFVYFAYDYSAFRNKIAHGEMIDINREKAYEVIMDVYWIIKQIDSDQRDYKLWLKLIEKCTDLPASNKQIQGYFTGLDAEKYIELLKRHLYKEFKKALIWYNLGDQADKFNSFIQNRRFYDAIWDEKTPQTYEESIEVDGKKIPVMTYNNEPLKYQLLVEELRKYNYVPEDWYQQYAKFCDDIEKQQKIDFQKIEKNLR